MSDTLTVLDDGQLHFKIRNRAGEETEHAIDVLLLRLVCEECETSHNLKTDANGHYLATASFLTDLTGRLTAVGVHGCTPSLARQLWSISAAEIESLQKKTNETLNSPSGLESNLEPSPSENASGY